MAKGTALHQIAENYLRDGTAPPDTELGRLFTLGLPFLPPPGTAKVEGKFTATLRDVAYTGAIDLTHEREGVLVLQDHKTSSDPNKYGLREKADYLADPQALIYALHLMLQNGRDSIVLEWVYYRTKGKPKAQATACLVTFAEVLEAFNTVVHPLATELVSIRKKGLTASALPRNTDSCLVFGQRCPHYDVCNPLGQDNDMALPIDDDFFAEPTTTTKIGASISGALEKQAGKDLMAGLEDDEEAQAEKALAAAKAAKAAKVAKQQQDAIDAAKAEEKAKLNAAAAKAKEGFADLINAPEKAAKKAPEPKAVTRTQDSPLKVVCEELSAALAKIAARI